MKPLRTTGTATCVWGMSTPRARKTAICTPPIGWSPRSAYRIWWSWRRPDSVLVADRARTQDVKKIVESLKKEGRGEAGKPPAGLSPVGELRNAGER